MLNQLIVSLDLRWVAAIAYVFIGLALTATTIRVWWMSPHHRAELFGPYLTPDGLRAFLWTRPLTFLMGCLFLVCGIARWFYYKAGTSANGTAMLANGIGILEAIFAAWVGVSVAVVAVWLWRGH